MTFDIEKTPPTKTEVEAEAAIARTTGERWIYILDESHKRVFRVNICVFGCILLGICLLGLHVLTRVELLKWGGICATFGAFLGVPYSSWYEKKILKNLAAVPQPAIGSLMRLTKISTDQALQVVPLCQQNETVSLYQTAVAQQGRPLVDGEYKAMRAYVASLQAREAQEALKGPVPFARQSP